MNFCEITFINAMATVDINNTLTPFFRIITGIGQGEKQNQILLFIILNVFFAIFSWF